MKQLKKKDLEDYKNQLLKLRKELSSEAQKDLQNGMETPRDDSKNIDDFAQNENDIDIWAISNNQKHDMLLKIENALERVHNKSYGLCVYCNQEISEPRLKAIPYADMCISCKEKEEQRNSGNGHNSFYSLEEDDVHDDDREDSNTEENIE